MEMKWSEDEWEKTTEMNHGWRTNNGEVEGRKGEGPPCCSGSSRSRVTK